MLLLLFHSHLTGGTSHCSKRCISLTEGHCCLVSSCCCQVQLFLSFLSHLTGGTSLQKRSSFMNGWTDHCIQRSSQYGSHPSLLPFWHLLQTSFEQSIIWKRHPKRSIKTFKYQILSASIHDSHIHIITLWCAQWLVHFSSDTSCPYSSNLKSILTFP